MQGQALLAAIVASAPDLTKCRRQFISHMLLLYLSVRSRINFTQLARHSDQYCEHAMRLNFERYADLATMNRHLVEQHGSGHYVLALDASWLPKSGKKTPGVGKYWSGTAQKALWGLEVCLLSVIDVDKHTAWHLDAVQTPDAEERQAKGIGLVDHYAQIVDWQIDNCQALSGYLAADAYFAKAAFVERVRQSGLHLVSRLRKDARLRYLYTGPKTGKPGRPREFASRVDLAKPDLAYFTLSHQDEQLLIYSAVVNCPFLKRNIKLAYTQYLDVQTGQPTHYKLHFSTDVDLPAWMIVKYYGLRYQQEFLIRDAKGFTGLSDCQARSINKIDSHLNLALSAVNVAKVEQGVSTDKAFSMANAKVLNHNKLLLDKFISILPKAVELDENHPKVRELYTFGCKAA